MTLSGRPNITIKQSLLNQVPFILGLIFSVIALFWVSLNYSWTVQKIDVGLFIVPFPLFGIVPLVVSAHLLRRLYDRKMILCHEYINYVEGIFSWKEKTVRFEYEHIREIEIDQTLLQKLFGVGDITVTVVATAVESTAMMPGVRKPRGVKDLIRSRIHLAEDINDIHARGMIAAA